MRIDTIEAPANEIQTTTPSSLGRHYAAPRLKLLGRMSELTASGSKTSNENGKGNSTKP